MSTQRTDHDALARTTAIRALNDAFRTSFVGGAVMVTQSIIALGAAAQLAIIAKVQAFTAFDAGNDPYHEHDFGAFEHAGQKVFFKIDYYDRQLAYGSEDPAEPAVTTRVLTIMLASDY
jgi:hypothetical protein